IAFLLGAIGKDCECVEADLAVGAITPPLDYLDRPIQERANPFRLRDGTLLARLQDRPRRPAPDSVHVDKRSHSLSLRFHQCGGITSALSSRPGGQRKRQCHRRRRRDHCVQSMVQHLLTLQGFLFKQTARGRLVVNLVLDPGQRREDAAPVRSGQPGVARESSFAPFIKIKTSPVPAWFLRPRPCRAASQGGLELLGDYLDGGCVNSVRESPRVLSQIPEPIWRSRLIMKRELK